MSEVENLLTGDLKKTFLHYLVTSVAGMLIFAIYILIDTLFIGRFLGSEGLAALNVALPMYGILTGLGLLLGVGGAAAMSVSLGENKPFEVEALFSTSVTLGIVCVSVLTFLSVVLQEQFIALLGGSQVNTSMVKEYLLPLVLFSFSFVFTQLLTPFVRHDGAPVLAMWSTILGGLVNIALDALFIVVLGWGMFGAALATALASVLSLALLVQHIQQSQLLRFKRNKVTWARIRRIISNGSASLVVEFSSGLVLFAYNHVLLASVGEVGVAGYGVIANYSLIVLAIFSGIGQAIQPLVSINYGANQLERSLTVRNMGLAVSVVLSFFFYGIGLFFPEALTRFFVAASPELLEITVYGIRFYFLSFFFSGLNIILAAYFQAIEEQQKSLQITVLRGFILVSIGLLILPRFLGLAGIWSAVAMAELLTFVWIRYRKKDRPVVQNA